MSGIACDSRVFRPDAVKPFRAFKHREGWILRVLSQKKFGPVRNKGGTREQDGTEMVLVPRRNGIVQNIPKKIEARKRSDASNNPDEGIFLSFHFLFLLYLARAYSAYFDHCFLPPVTQNESEHPHEQHIQI
jgi:hypothetical protein